MTPPQVLSCDPPSWWAGHTLNPVRLMIRGRGLSGARLEAASGGLSFGKPRVSDSGHYLWVDVKVAKGAKPGRRAFNVVTREGSVEAALEILPSLPRKGRLESFSPDDVIYLIMPDRFAQGRGGGRPDLGERLNRERARSYHGGDLRGVIEKLPYLKDLGVTAIWLTPLYKNTTQLHPANSWSSVPFTDYHGYGPVDYYAMDESFGDFATLRELSRKAHAAGLKLILDQVSNHTGQHHPWVADLPTKSWYHGSPESHRDNTFQTWVVADPYASDELRAGMLDGWFGGILPDLNQDDGELERYLTQNILWWIGMGGADGMRHDVVSCIPRRYWRNVFAAVKREYPDFKTIGEVNGDIPPTVAAYQGRDCGLDSPFDFPLRQAIRGAFLENQSVEKLPSVLSEDWIYEDAGTLVTCFGLHDDSRFMGHPKATIAAIKLAFTFVLTTRGIPLVYYGDELAMVGGDDPDNRRDFPGGWAEDARDAFMEKGRTEDEQAVFAHARSLMRLRARCEPLRRGRLVNLAVDAEIYAYARLSKGEGAVVLLNNADKPRVISFDAAPLRAKKFEARLGGVAAPAAGGRFDVELPGRSSAVFTFTRSKT